MRLRFSALVLIAGCSSPPPPPAPPAFDRPESVDFFCFDQAERAIVDIGSCAPVPPPAGEDDFGRPAEPFELHALVTQTATGEVAAVQVTGEDADPPHVIDSDVRVPGFTFVAVGEVPSAVVTPRSRPDVTYVLSRGSSELHVIETATFRRGLGANVTPARPDLFPRGARPSAMALTPAEDALVVALPGTGEVWLLPIDGAVIGDPVPIALTTDVPPPVDLTAAADQPPEHVYACGLAMVRPTAALPPRAPVSLGAAPAPWALAVDAERNRVLVADRALPLVHVIDLVTRTAVAPISVSVPTRALVLTPRVPAAPGGTERTERYLYAIDALDQSVLAIDYSDPARDSFGAVLTIGPDDRLDVPFPARALEVVRPGYGADPTFCTDREARPTELRGVFLAVATVDGRVRFFDVFDLDTTCRGTSDACAGSVAADDDDIVAIGRHRPRIGAFVTEGVEIDPAPGWTVGASTTRVDEDSGLADDRVPPMLSLDACPAGLGPVFPVGSSAPRVCAVTDPWAATSQRFTASYDGTIPSTATSGGNFDETRDFLEVRFDPCALGVIGSADVPPDGPLAGYGGDVVAITGPLPPSLDEGVRPRCADLAQENAAGETTPILLPLRSASSRPEGARDTYRGRLVVGDPLDREGFSLADVRACFPELLELEVRVRGAFLVESTRAGFRHPIVRDEADGRCVVDPGRAAERGRAFPEERFATSEIAFELGPLPEGIERPVLEMLVSGVPPPLSLDVSVEGSTDLPSLVAELEYGEIDERLYVVDQARRGLVRVRLTEIAIQSVFR